MSDFLLRVTNLFSCVNAAMFSGWRIISDFKVSLIKWYIYIYIQDTPVFLSKILLAYFISKNKE